MRQAREPAEMGFITSRLDLATQERTQLDLPRQALVSEVTPDGKAYVVTLLDLAARKARLALVSRDGRQVTELLATRFEVPDPHLSPDGTRILYLDHDPANKPVEGFSTLPRLFVYDLAAKTSRRVDDLPPAARLTGGRWSPGGKRVAYSWKQLHPGVPDWEEPDKPDDPKKNVATESRVATADADGTHARTLLSAKAGRTTATPAWTLDWR